MFHGLRAGKSHVGICSGWRLPVGSSAQAGLRPPSIFSLNSGNSVFCSPHRDEAEMEYLKIAQDLEMYGVNYFAIRVCWSLFEFPVYKQRLNQRPTAKMGYFLIPGWQTLYWFSGGESKRKGRGSYSLVFYFWSSIRSLVIKCQLSPHGDLSLVLCSAETCLNALRVTFDYFWLCEIWPTGSTCKYFLPPGHEESEAAFTDYWFVVVGLLFSLAG